jgi:hypothetical protein
MSENLLSQKFDDGVLKAFGARLAAHQKAKGVSGNVAEIEGANYEKWKTSGDHARRLNAYCYITKEGSAYTLSTDFDQFESRYPDTNKRKPRGASLKKVTINRVTTTAERINLTLEILVEYEVYNYSDFQNYAREFLRRPESGSPLTVRFAHVKDSLGRGIKEQKITDVWVIGGGYTQEGSKWVCTFKAIAPASGITAIDMSKASSAIPGGLYFKAVKSGYMISTQSVRSLYEYILYALQVNGTTLTENLEDGTEVNNFKAPLKAAWTQPIGKVFKPFEGSPVQQTGSPAPFFGLGGISSGQQIGVDTGAVEYVSLKFIVELVNAFILQPANDSYENGALNLKIELLSDSKSYIPPGGTVFKSGNPLDVLFLNGKNAGTYKANEDPSTGKDFEVGGKYFGGCVQGTLCFHDKILISRRAVIGPLIDALKRIEEEKSSKNTSFAKASDPNAFINRIITIGTFFETLFRIIQTASGSFVSLCFTHIKDGYKGEKQTHILRIDNCSYVNGTAPYHTLRPITGDGSTLSMTITGKLPDSMVALAIISNNGSGSATAAETSSPDYRLKNDTAAYQKIYKSLTSNSISSDPPGVFAKIGHSNFAAADISAACSALQALRDLTRPTGWSSEGGSGWTEYFDVELKAEMEGAFPIIVGNRVTSEGLPDFLTVAKGLAFVILDITDVIEAPGIWTTSISARLCHL